MWLADRVMWYRIWVYEFTGIIFGMIKETERIKRCGAVSKVARGMWKYME